jgi:hypothetical protein
VAAIGWMQMTGIADADALMGSNRLNDWPLDLGSGGLSHRASSNGRRGISDIRKALRETRLASMVDSDHDTSATCAFALSDTLRCVFGWECRAREN